MDNSDKRTRQLQKEARKLARKPILEQFTHAFEVAIPRLVALLEDPGTSPREVISATELLAGYILSKPKVTSEVTQTITQTVPQATVDKLVSGLSQDQLAAMLADIK